MLLTEAQQPAKVPDARELSFSRKAAALTLPRDLSTQVPLYRGQNSHIYKIEAGGSSYALKLLRQATDSDTMESREACARFINATDASWRTPFIVVTGEVKGEGGSCPALLMEWVDGDPLYEYIPTILHDRKALTALQGLLIDLWNSLEEADCSHGDINLHHILVSSNKSSIQLRLVDYETAFIPSFEGRMSPGAGTPGLQHPKKLATHYASYSDRFSFWVMLTALEALKLLPQLWEERESKTDRNLIFSLGDLVRPAQSPLVQKLKSYHEPALDYYLSMLEQWCTERRPEKIDGPRLFGDGDIPYIPKGAAASSPKPVTVEKESIIDFHADRTTVRKGDKITLHWHVKGKAPHITGMGQVSSTRASASLTPDRSGPVTCTVGSVQKSIHITVTPVISPQTSPDYKEVIQKKLPAVSAKKILLPLGAIALAGVLYFSLRGSNGHDGTQLQTATLAPVTKAAVPAFTEASVKGFLQNLYAAYNAKDLKAIMPYYAPGMEQYYETGKLSADSLQKILGPLFIETAMYSCTPDFKTMQVTNKENGCEVHITIEEKVQNTANDKVEIFRTPIIYKLDNSFRIVAEKSGES